MKDHKSEILQNIINDLIKAPKGLKFKGDQPEASKSLKIEIMGGHDAHKPLEGSAEEESLESPHEEMLEDHEPEMEIDDEGPLGGVMRGSAMSELSKPSHSFGKGKRR